MNARPGRPARSKPTPAPIAPAKAPKLPKNLSAAQQAHLDELLSDPRLDTTGLLDQYISTLRLKDKAEKQLGRGLIIGTERGAKKTSPAWQIYNSSCDRLLRIREMMTRARQEQPAPPAPGTDAEQRIQAALADPTGMELLIDDQGMDVPGDASWRSDPRILAKRRLQ